MDALLHTGPSSYTLHTGIEGKVSVNIVTQCSVTIHTEHC